MYSNYIKKYKGRTDDSVIRVTLSTLCIKGSRLDWAFSEVEGSANALSRTQKLFSMKHWLMQQPFPHKALTAPTRVLIFKIIFET